MRMSPNDFAALLKKITVADILRAAADVLDKRLHNFRPAREWEVVIAGRRFPHRALIAFAAERYMGRVLTNQDEDFEGTRDTACRRFFEAKKFAVRDKRRSSTPS